MDERIADTIERHLAGVLTIAEAKMLILAELPGGRQQHETLLLADYIEDQLDKVRRERLSAAEAARDLCAVGMMARL